MERPEKIALLQQLMQELYLSTACASGDHMECRLAQKYRSFVCCCPVCDHEGRSLGEPLPCGPLLRVAEAPEEEADGYVYRDGLGVRTDLVALAADIVLKARAKQHGVVMDAARRIGMFLAPRF